jgi:hypothetical protein
MRLRLGDSTGSASLPESEFFQPFSGEGGFFYWALSMTTYLTYGHTDSVIGRIRLKIPGKGGDDSK